MQGLGTLKDLYKIESGEILVEKFLLDRILQRLGMNTSMIEVIITEEDWECYLDRMRMYELYYKKDYEKLNQEIQIYKKKTEEKSPIHVQFAEVMEAKSMMKRKKNAQEILKVLERALKRTVWNWEIQKTEDICLAPEELEIIILIAKYLRKLSYHKKHGNG